MNNNYILINSRKLDMPNWIKWITIVLIYCLFSVISQVVEEVISIVTHINIAMIALMAFYIKSFVVLSAIYDLAPKFKKSISILFSIVATIIYSGIDFKAGDTLYFGIILFIVAVSAYNIFLYRDAINLKVKDI